MEKHKLIIGDVLGSIVLIAALLAWLAVLGCSHTEKREVKATAVATVQLDSVKAAERTKDTIEKVTTLPTIVVETWKPDGTHRRVTRTGKIERTKETKAKMQENVVAHGQAKTELKGEEHSKNETKASFGFQLWLVFVPVGLILLGIGVWKLIPFWRR